MQVRLMILLISDSCHLKTNFHFGLEVQNKDFQCTQLFSTVLVPGVSRVGRAGAKALPHMGRGERAQPQQDWEIPE